MSAGPYVSDFVSLIASRDQPGWSSGGVEVTRARWMYVGPSTMSEADLLTDPESWEAAIALFPDCLRGVPDGGLEVDVAALDGSLNLLHALVGSDGCPACRAAADEPDQARDRWWQRFRRRFR